MSKKTKKSKSKSRVAKCTNTKLTTIITPVFETIWAVGVSVVAAIGISAPI